MDDNEEISEDQRSKNNLKDIENKLINEQEEEKRDEKFQVKNNLRNGESFNFKV